MRHQPRCLATVHQTLDLDKLAENGLRDLAMTIERSPSDRRRTALALGSGSARGMAHIGVIRALAELGIVPDIVCGTSIGALVGAAYTNGHLDTLEGWVRSLSTRDVVHYLDISLSADGGFADARRLMDYFRQEMGDPGINDLPLPFAAVATDLQSGREIWLREGRLWDGVRASIAIPGILTPIQRDGRWLVDGGLVNPVPVSVCRALDADVVVAVNLNGDIVGRRLSRRTEPSPEAARRSTRTGSLDKLTESFKLRADALMAQFLQPTPESPGLFEVLATSLNIMQDRITRSRMAGDPPDVVIAPRLADIGLLEFDEAAAAIDEGYAAVRRMRPILEDTFGRLNPV